MNSFSMTTLVSLVMAIVLLILKVTKVLNLSLMIVISPILLVLLYILICLLFHYIRIGVQVEIAMIEFTQKNFQNELRKARELKETGSEAKD